MGEKELGAPDEGRGLGTSEKMRVEVKIPCRCKSGITRGFCSSTTAPLRVALRWAGFGDFLGFSFLLCEVKSTASPGSPHQMGESG